MTADAPTEAWIDARRAGAVRALRGAVSATHLERVRKPFGWRIRPAPGSVLASPRIAAWDPEPDYFHHWVRDAAIVMRMLPEIVAASDEPDWWRQAFADHVAFSLRVSDPERQGLQRNPLAATTQRDHLPFLRPDEEFAALAGEAWLGEPRFAADGGPDLERWSRPQDDGPALRASACLRVVAALPELQSDAVDRLLARDLAHLARVAGRPCIGPWEEAPARRSTFTLIAQWDALDRGARWRAARGETEEAEALRARAESVARLVEAAADPHETAWRESIEAPPGQFDSATLLAILHADRADGPFAVTAPRTLGTVSALERSFTALYPLSRGREAVPMGRWAKDVFFGGNPWFPVTLGCAELHYRIAALTGAHWAQAKAEAWMALVADLAPPGDDLPEQFDRATGAPVSCQGLSWSAAAMLGALAARDAAVQALAAR